MGPPPVDIDQASALPPAQRKAAERKAAEQTKKDYPKSKPPAKKFSKGGVTRADGCAVKGHTRGRMV
jgi:hypothetical protein